MYGIFTYIYHKFKPNVGKYTSPMDPMGSGNNIIIINNQTLRLLPIQFGCLSQ